MSDDGWPQEWPDDARAEWVVGSGLADVLAEVRKADWIEVDEDALTMTLFRDTDPDVRDYLDGP